MKNRLISFVLSIVIVVICICPSLVIADAAVWNGGRTTPTLTGGVYQIATAENLAWFAYAVNSGNVSIKGVLTADIFLNAVGSLSREWTPIGTPEHPFKGSFDGNGHTVSGVYINSSDDYVGFFGVVSYPDSTEEPEDVSPEFVISSKTYSIQNVIIVSSSVSGHQNVGGISGYCSNAGLKGCSYSGTVTGSFNSVGGVIGWAYSSTVVSQCFSSGNVYGLQRTGGIAGFTSGNSVITGCYSDMAVAGTLNVGGLVGTLSSSSLLGGFFLGGVNGTDRIGGIAGYSAFGTVTSAYTVSTLNGNGVNIGGAVGIIYGGEYNSIFYSYETSGYDGPVGLGRTVTEIKHSDFIKQINHSGVYFCFDYTNINDGFPVLTWMLKSNVWTGELSIPSVNSSGTYLISKPSELAWFAALVNGTLSNRDAEPNANATVTDNLLLNINVYDDSMGLNEWTPIGTPSNPYTGTFNGGGYNIAGVYTLNTAATSGTYVGLFGYVGSGTINNTVLIDCLIQGKENVGGICGFLFGGRLNNDYCDSEIRGDRAVGGIVGNIGSSTSQVNCCAMVGKITGTNVSNNLSNLQNFGGVAGYNNRATITKCFSNCTLFAPEATNVGGVLGNNAVGSLTASYSISTVTGKTMVGGIVGLNNNGTVQRCYTVGKVFGSSSYVGIAFGNTTGSNVSNCSYDSAYASLSNHTMGATGLSSTQMTGSYSYSTMGLGYSDFKSTANDLYFYYYPQIYSMYNSSVPVIRNSSVESVKMVQDIYIARVEIDGRTDTFYESLDDAFEYASVTVSSVLPTVFLLRDIEISETLNVTGNVGFYGENGAVLSRSASLSALPMINVTGELSLGSKIYGLDTEPEFYIDGNNLSSTSSGITVSSAGTLNICPGVVIQNFNTESHSVRGSAVSNSGTLNMSGGLFNSDKSRNSVGGAIYNIEGTVSISSGCFYGCSATQGAAVFNNNGSLIISGGMFDSNIATTYGGAVCSNGVYAESSISGNSSFLNNEASFGGAVAVLNYSTFEISDGTLSSNTAYSMGGAVYIQNGSELVLSGGIISSNSVDYSTSTQEHFGNGVYNDGVFSIKGAGHVSSNNDVYLNAGKHISVIDRLTTSGYVAVITPSVYSEQVVVLDGNAMSTSYTKFGLSNPGWHILANGKITTVQSQTVALVSKNNAYSVEYISLLDAFSAVSDNDTAIITVVADNLISDTISVHGDVTLTCDDSTFTSMRSGSFNGILFDITNGSTLRLGDVVANTSCQAQTDYDSGILTEGQMVLDGGYSYNGVTGAACVNVRQGATLYMYDDAIIRDFNNSSTSPVTVYGTMHMFGGSIVNNISAFGGAIFVRNGGVLNLYGGVIADNTSANGGNAVYSEGTVVKNIHSYDYYFVDKIYDDDHNIIGTADPVYEDTLKTDILFGENQDIYLTSNMIYVGETTSDIFITSLTALPVDVSFNLHSAELSLNSYTVGAVAVTGTNVSQYYSGFSLTQYGYYILPNGTLGINKLIPKTTSHLHIDNENSFISGFNLSDLTVNKVSNMFVNSASLIKVRSATGTNLRNTMPVTTGCVIQLLNSSNTVIDTVYIVVYGDVNCDNQIDGLDSVYIKAVSQGLFDANSITPAQLEAADVTFDGIVNSLDSDFTDSSGVFEMTINQIR